MNNFHIHQEYLKKKANCNVGAVYFRDIALEKLGFKAEDLDNR